MAVRGDRANGDEGAPLAIGDWNYLAVTNDSANGVDRLRGYINGIITHSGTGTSVKPGSPPLDLGSNDTADRYAALVDEIRTHNTEQRLAHTWGRAIRLNSIPEPSTAMLAAPGVGTILLRHPRSQRVQSLW